MERRSIAILYNPTSGRGRSAALATEIADAARAAGFVVSIAETPRRNEERAAELLAAVDGAVLIGGDGTLMAMLSALQAAQKPFYLVPAGNESLAARYCGMSAKPADVVDRLRRWSPRRHGVGTAAGRPFFTMVSCGLDADIIARIAQTRTGPIGHLGYLRPAVHALLGYRVPRCTLRCDGVTVVDQQPGYCIIANNPTYARGLNPVPEASTDAATLAARFYPNADWAFAARTLLRAVVGGQMPTEDSLLFQGVAFELSTESPAAVQADGEAVGSTPIAVERSALPVWTFAV